MASFFDKFDAWMVALTFAAGMIISWRLGQLRGQRAGPDVGEDPGSKFIDASLALLGLLLAFTFSMALNHHDQRRLAVVAESNAIGDFYTCASLLKEPQRPRLQAVIREYAQFLRSTAFEFLPEDEDKSDRQRLQKLTGEMTAIVDKALDDETPIAVPLTNTLNNVTSAAASRLVAFQARLPWSISLMLLLGSVVPAFLIGEKQGALKRVHLTGTTCFVLLVTLVIYITLDINQPRRGVITVSQDSLDRVIQSMGR